MLDKYTAISKETGEITSLENVFQGYLKSKSAKVVERSKSIKEIYEKLNTNALELTTSEITKLAKAESMPIDSFNSFFSVSLSPHYLDLNLSVTSNTMFSGMLKLLNKGHKISSHSNNKPIKNLENLYNSMKVSKATFYRSKKELEDKRLIKIIESVDRVLILLNPVYIRCGKMDSTVFYEFEKEIAKENPLEWLFFVKKFNMGNSILLKNEDCYIYKSKFEQKDIESK